MEQITGFLKQKVFQIDGFQITVGLVILALVLYWFVFAKR